MTLTIFETFNYDTVITSIPLTELLVENNEKDNDCIDVTYETTKITFGLCTM